MLPATWKQNFMKKISFFGGGVSFALLWYKIPSRPNPKEEIFLVCPFLLLGKTSIEKNPGKQFFMVFSFLLLGKNPFEIQENIFYILFLGCFEWFLFCYIPAAFFAIASPSQTLQLWEPSWERRPGRWSGWSTWWSCWNDHIDCIDPDDRNDRWSWRSKWSWWLYWSWWLRWWLW